MSLVLGALLGLGLVFLVAPLLWPAGRPAANRRRAGGSRMRDELALAGLGRVPIAVLVVAATILAAIAAGVGHAVFGVPVLTLSVGLLGVLALPLAVRSRANRRRETNLAVWPDVVDHLVASVRAGMSLPDSVGALGALGPAPTRGAFAGFAADYRRTGNFSACIETLKHELADPTADRILETLRMAREVGGSDLTVVLRGLAGYLREDSALRAEVRARQSWIRNAARLGVAAPWLLLLVLATKHETIAAYDSRAGGWLIVVGVAVTVVAYRMMVSIGRLPVERRWFQ